NLSINGTSLRAEETYRTDGMQPPQVFIDSPAPNAAIDRLVEINRDLAELSFGVSSTTVAATVTWADGNARDITEAVLIVTENGAEVNRIAIDPPSNNAFDFTWDISNIQSDGANARVLQV